MLWMTISGLALFAFAVSWMIFLHRRRGAPLPCARGDECGRVMESRYARLLGISNETVGIWFFGAVAFLSLLYALGVKGIVGVPLHPTLVVFTGIAAGYASLLTFFQLFVLRGRCAYCLISSAVGILIFLLALL